ncbi:MAG: abortive phage resistance protein [Cytophagaceae bacterium]|nr:MAG: abortive phage resistance protein [Cytophagaceae bacterium]
MVSNEILRHAESMQHMMIARATGGEVKSGDYQEARAALTNEDSIRHLLPSFVKTCRSPDQFWSYIQLKDEKYRGRREHIWSGFKPLLDYLERGSGGPADLQVSSTLAAFDAEHVQAAWAKALQRREADAEGAITSARTLIEAVCKHILDGSGSAYDDKDDLPKLYKLTAELLNIAPSQHTEQVFKQVLGGCTAVIEGLGTLRNRLSDAHGKGKTGAKPAARHAELAVNLSGALALFLLATWRAKSAGTVK